MATQEEERYNEIKIDIFHINEELELMKQVLEKYKILIKKTESLIAFGKEEMEKGSKEFNYLETNSFLEKKLEKQKKELSQYETEFNNNVKLKEELLKEYEKINEKTKQFNLEKDLKEMKEKELMKEINEMERKKEIFLSFKMRNSFGEQRKNIVEENMTC